MHATRFIQHRRQKLEKYSELFIAECRNIWE